jgi:Stigma-specific protein, Stig1
MNLPRFTADLALYQTTNVYRSFGSAAGLRAVYIADATICPVVGGCPVRVFGCGTCPEGETCCYLDTVISGGYKNEYYACRDLQTNTGDCGTCGHVCSSGEVCCNGTCVDATSPTYKCSAQCGCANGMTCQNGACNCLSGQTICNGYCSNLNSDWQNCGSCGNVCPDLGNTMCVNGVCQCMVTGDIICNGSCTNPYADSNNCGACDNVCPPNTCCSSGSCIATQLQTDPNNCGSCGNRCSSNCCSNGTCVSPLLNDPNNCGSCGNICDNGCCTQGPYGTYACADFSNDPNNCGRCGNVCTQGVCCSGTCVDNLYTNPRNCGACGNVCSSGCCSQGVCADLSNNPNNCRTCGNVCPPITAVGGCCLNSACVTGPSLSSVSTNPSNPGCGTASANTNYWLGAANCANLQGLTVTVDTEGGGIFSETPFSLQLNAIPPPNQNQIYNMQYSFIVDGGGVSAWVEYWFKTNCISFTNQNNVGSNCCSNGNCCQSTCATQIALSNPIPANTIGGDYTLQISLSSNASTGNVTQATFVVTDWEGNRNPLIVPIPASAQVPIQAFQFVAVGMDNCAAATFSNQSAALIDYSVQSGQLCVQGSSTSCSGNGFIGITEESSNATYGTMNSCCGSELQQALLGYPPVI